MRLLSLEVTNYRNIASASLTPGRELTVICGNNLSLIHISEPTRRS